MGKSIRSKTKRSYRSKKRDDGVYAATEAARLERLSAKLAAKIAEPAQDTSVDHMDRTDAGEGDDGGMPGWSYLDYSLLGLLDHTLICPESLGTLLGRRATPIDRGLRCRQQRNDRSPTRQNIQS
jgi:hypothetical protein